MHAILRATAVLCLVLPAWGLDPITSNDAVRLLALQDFPIASAETRLIVRDGVPYYTVAGMHKGISVEAAIDARAARVLQIRKNGEAVYTFPGVLAVGHRGTVKFAPENTIAAFNKAIDHGADLLEMDVRQTSDGHLVVIHDQSVARTTDQRGDVAGLTLEEIKALDAGSWFGEEFSRERVPTFSEALAAIEGRAVPDIDFKAGDPEKLVDAVREAGLLGKVTLYCGDWQTLKAVLALDSGFIIRPTAPKGLPGLSDVLTELDPPIVNIDWKYFSEELIRAIHLSGRKAFVNTMGDHDNAASMVRAIDAGADYLQTDHLDVLLPLLRQRGLHK
jgi:glycerophosphoryl diester phosphodiesterase